MPAIQDYQIVGAASYFRLEEDVRKEIKNGWQPIGNPVTSDIDNNGHQEWFQAMIKIGD